MDQVTPAIFLAIINSKLIDALKAPVSQRYPDLDLWWVLYVNFLTGLGLTWLAQVNVFGALIVNDVAGVLLTGFLVGGGSSLIYDIFTDKPASSIEVKTTRQKDSAGSRTQVSVSSQQDAEL